MADDFEPAERGLRDHLALWRRRAAIILGITALAVVAMLALSLTQTKTYQASAQVIFPVEPAGQPGQDPGQVRFDPNRVIQTEAIFAAGDQVRAKVDEKVGAGGTITARGLKDSDVVVITATASDPQRAALLANTAAAAYVELRQPPAGGSGVTGVAGVQIVDPAEAPSAAANGSLTRNLAFALAIGLVLGLVAAYAVDHLDDAVRDDDALERATGIPVLGMVTDPMAAIDSSGATGSAAASGIRPVALDDPVLAGAERSALLGAVEDAPNAGASRVLVVPIKARGRDVRDAIELLQGVGIEVVATVLVTATPRRAPADGPPPGPVTAKAPADVTPPRPDSLSPSLAADAEPSAQPAGRRPRA